MFSITQPVLLFAQSALLLAQAAGGFTILQWLIVAIIVAGAIGIAMIIAQKAGIAIPQWFWAIVGIVIAVVIGVVAIKFLATML